MAATATANPFRIMDNSALDSSMDSTQGLLGFMASASRQIKTYLGPEQQQKSNQNKRRHQQLLFQLAQLKTQNYSFIPDILDPSNKSPLTPCTNNFFGVDSSPASPTPSLDSVGSVEEIEAPTYRHSCLIKSRRKKRTRPTMQCSIEDSINNKRTKYNNNCSSITSNLSTCAFFEDSNDSMLSMNTPCPSPDFDDLVDCMLTEDALAKIDVNNYLPQL